MAENSPQRFGVVKYQEEEKDLYEVMLQVPYGFPMRGHRLTSQKDGFTDYEVAKKWGEEQGWKFSP